MILPSIWLASASPRRHEMLKWIGLPFKIMAVNLDESLHPKENPTDYVKRLANEKALAASLKINPAALIIAADTTVVYRGEILGKPADKTDAFRILQEIRSDFHQVITCLVLFNIREKTKKIEICTSLVKMRNYSDEEIQTYVQSGDPLDKAGAYAIQHPDFSPVVDFRGCFASVMGMPLCHLERNLRLYADYQPLAMHKICQKYLDYTCPIHERILIGENIG